MRSLGTTVAQVRYKRDWADQQAATSIRKALNATSAQEYERHVADSCHAARDYETWGKVLRSLT